MNMHRRSLLLAGPAFAAAPRLAAAAWPERPVTVVNPFAAGGWTDPFGRIVTAQLQRAFGQPFIFDHRPGAGATLGAAHVARSAPDGQTLLFSPTTAWVISPYLQRNAGYDPIRDFAPIAAIGSTPMVLCTRAGLGFADVATLAAAARARPGGFSYASAGAGSLPHLMGAFFAALAGLELTHVPYRGGGPAMNDLLAGHVDLMCEAVPNVAPHAETGRLVPLMGSGAARSGLLPRVPTVAEAGFPDLDLTSWIGFAAPARTPGETIAALNRETNAAIGSAEMRALMARLGMLADGGPPAAMAARMAREGAIYRRIIAEAGITTE